MEYNTQRTRLHLPEYGRNIQQLIRTLQELPTKEERNEMAACNCRFYGAEKSAPSWRGKL